MPICVLYKQKLLIGLLFAKFCRFILPIVYSIRSFFWTLMCGLGEEIQLIDTMRYFPRATIHRLRHALRYSHLERTIIGRAHQTSSPPLTFSPTCRPTRRHWPHWPLLSVSRCPGRVATSIGLLSPAHPSKPHNTNTPSPANLLRATLNFSSSSLPGLHERCHGQPHHLYLRLASIGNVMDGWGISNCDPVSVSPPPSARGKPCCFRLGHHGKIFSAPGLLVLQVHTV